MSITRVRWRERQVLAAADLSAEQDYHLHALGRHYLAPHGWGVIRGLWLAPKQPRRSKDWHVHPGVAIDGYGRELLVTRPIDFTIPAQGAFGVFLYYCEARVSRPPCAACADEPLPRVGQYVHVVIDQLREPLTGDGVALDLARAAGGMPGYPAWPVLLGIVHTDGGAAVQYQRTRYHRQRASLLAAPSERAQLRLGLLGPEDPYHLMLATASGTPRPIRRLAIDRDGQVHAWRPVAISGPKASGLVQLSQRAVLAVEADMPTGFGRRVLLTGRLEDPLQPKLTVDWRDTLGLRFEESVALKAAKSVHLDEEIRFGGAGLVALKVLNRALAARVSVVERPKDTPTEPRFIAQSFAVELSPKGGRLELTTLDPGAGPPAPEPCDPVTDDSGQAPPPKGAVLQLLPAGAPYTPGPSAREVYAQSTPAPDGTPSTDCRLSGGAFDDGDRTSRVGFGARVDDSTSPGTLVWQPLLTMDAGGRVAMPQKGTVLQIGHTLQLPPVTTDPADPLTQDLLALAYNAGLLRVGKVSSTKPIITVVPASVTIGAELDYTFTIATGTVVKRLLEIIVGTNGNGDVIVRSLPLTTTATSPLTYSVKLPGFYHRADVVKLVIQALLSEGDKDRFSQSAPKAIAVSPA
jgi:hypothetical protein